MAGAGADGFADADFARALRDGDEHDVHDANATDDERDARNESEHAGNDGKHRAGWVKVAVSGDDLEVFVTILELFELLFNLSDSGVDVARSVGADIDLLNLNRRFEGAGEVDVDQNGVIKVDVIEIDWIVHLVENAYDHELFVIVGESASDGFGRTEERHRGFVANDSNVFAELVIEELAIL